MRLSVCCLTNEPPGRLAAVLEPLRALADEIVLAIDSRVDPSWMGANAPQTKKLHRVEVVDYERQLGWLFGLCQGEWILHLDGDEVPSAALVRRLPELMERRDVRQYWFRRAWLWPEPHQALDDAPWSSDFNNRLLRNDGTLRAIGVLHGHATPELPAGYVDEPLLHLDLLLDDERGRTDKAIRYEAARPLMIADGGGRFNESFYLPERRAEAPQLRQIAAEDLDRIRAALAAETPSVSRPVPEIAVTTAEASGGVVPRWLPEADYRARIEALGPVPSMAPGETVHVPFRVTNDGTVNWPWGDAVPPLIRPASRWTCVEDGSVLEGPRSPFTADVAPGRAEVARVALTAPYVPGRYELEVDLVHEHVRWFGCGLRFTVDVAPKADPHAPRLRPSPPADGPQVIPRLLHRVWLGGQPVPGEFERYWDGLRRLHPGWELRTWNEADLDGLGMKEELRRRARTASELSNLMRYEILVRHGGVYVDTDVEGRQPLDELLGGIDAFAGLELPGRVGTAVLGSVPGHPAFARAARIARTTLGLGEHSANANGPYMMSLVAEQEPGVHVFASERFYPYLWDEPERRDEPFPDAYLVHHWHRSWWASL